MATAPRPRLSGGGTGGWPGMFVICAGAGVGAGVGFGLAQPSTRTFGRAMNFGSVATSVLVPPSTVGA